jgi:hypothetical protein
MISLQYLGKGRMMLGVRRRNKKDGPWKKVSRHARVSRVGFQIPFCVEVKDRELRRETWRLCGSTLGCNYSISRIMKISTVFLLLAVVITAATAFVPPMVATQKVASSSTRFMSEEEEEAVPAPAPAPAPAPIPAASTTTSTSSKCISREEILSTPNRIEFGGIMWDPLKLSELGTDETIAWFRHSEIKHGRIAMAAFVGWWVVGAGLRFPGELAHGLDFADLPSKGLDAWAAVPGWGKAQMLIFAGLIEFHDELFFSRRGKHYMRGGTPGKVR